MNNCLDVMLREYAAVRSEIDARMQAQQQVWVQILGLVLLALAGPLLGHKQLEERPVFVLVVPGLFAYLAGIWAWHDNAIRALARYVATELRPTVKELVGRIDGPNALTDKILGWEPFKFREVEGSLGSEWPDRFLTLNRYGAALAGGALAMVYWLWVTKWGTRNTDLRSAVPLLVFDVIALVGAAAIVGVILYRWWVLRNELRG